MKENTYKSWYKEGTDQDEIMQIAHQRYWEKLLYYIKEKDLKEKKILDFGCNQGGLLRYIYQNRPFKYALGVDLATECIEIANNKTYNLPIEYKNTGRPDLLNQKFDLVLSTSVIYLIEDLNEHANIINNCLNANGVYYSTYVDNNGNPNLNNYYKKINEISNLKMQLHSLDDLAKAFVSNGFKIEMRRTIPIDFIEIDMTYEWNQRIEEQMTIEYEKAYILRFTKI